MNTHRTAPGLAATVIILIAELLAVNPAQAAAVANHHTLTGSQPFVTLLCTFSDEQYLPWSVERVEAVFSETTPGLASYWREVSYGQIDLMGSQVAGWFTMPQPTSDYSLQAVTPETLYRLATDCIAVADASVDFTQYTGINLVFNRSASHAWGSRMCLELDGAQRCYGVTWLYPGIAFWHGHIAHEMGHTFGMDHSYADPKDPYSNPWDMMSMNSYCKADNGLGLLAQHPIAYQKDLMGWIEPARKFIAGPVAEATIDLERLAQPTAAGYLMAEIAIPGKGGRYYTVEARRYAGYDANLLTAEGVLVHEVDPNRALPARLITRAGESQADAGLWLTGMTYTDAENGISISIDSATDTGYTVTIRTNSR